MKLKALLKGKRRLAVIGASLTLGALSLAAIALADNVQVNDLVTQGNTTKAPGDTGTATVRMVSNNSPGSPAPGDISGCNVADATDGVTATVTLNSNQPWLTIASPGSVTLDQCGNSGLLTIGYSVSGTAPNGGVATVSTSTVGGLSGSLYNEGSFTVTVVAPTTTNNPPTISLNGDAGDVTGNEGSPLSNSGAFSDQDNDALTLSATGAGSLTAPLSLVTPPGGGPWSWSYTPTDNGSGFVSVTADDGHGGTKTDSFGWSAANVAPSGTFNSPSAHVNEGSNFGLSLTGVSDPSNVDTAAGFTYAFDCGAGYGSFGSSSTANCTTATDGLAGLNVAAKVRDKDGGVSEYTGTVTVDNVNPTVGALTLGGATGTACTTGNTVTLRFSFSDPGVSDGPWAVDIDWGDGDHTPDTASAQGLQAQQSHIYAAGSYTVSVSVTDKDGGNGTNSSGSGAVSLLYNMSAIQPPFNPDGSSVWKYGSTVPVKVKITDCKGSPVSGLTPNVGTQLKSSANPTEGIDETQSTSGADTTGIMRYDATAGQYIYNLGSKYLPDGSATYYMYARESHSIGQKPDGTPSQGQSYQQFGLRLK